MASNPNGTPGATERGREGGGATRCAAILGPYQSGKTSLLEALLHATGTVERKGTVKDGNTVGDTAPEARERGASTELSIGHGTYLGDSWTFIDTPGGIEFTLDSRHACMIADVAVVVVEPEAAKAAAAGPILKFLDDHDIPHVVLINKMDQASESVRDILAALQGSSSRPLALRQVPIRDGEKVTGYVDLVSERAYRYREGEPSALIELPGSVAGREAEARNELLETLADFDDHLLEQLLEEMDLDKQEVYAHLAETLSADKLVPVLLGAGEHDHGVQRLLKLLRHETPDHTATVERRGLGDGEVPMAQVFKTIHAPHMGKLSHVRIWRGTVKDGDTLNGAKVSGIYAASGGKLDKRPSAAPGDVVALGRMDPIQTGDVLTPSGGMPDSGLGWPEVPQPVFARALSVSERNDEVKLSGALAKLAEEDPSLLVRQDQELGELTIWGQGDTHLRVTVERLKSRFKLDVSLSEPAVAYRESIRNPVDEHARHKKQSGGHGQFADIRISVEPTSRGSGFAFAEKVVGGSVPKNYIPAVEEGCREGCKRGPLGFPVVDVKVTLTDGQHHSVDSSDMAFKIAARSGLQDALAKAGPVLLEPIHQVTIAVPSEATSKVHGILSSRRGQILGFDAKDGWPGWDAVTAYLPEAEMHDLILDLRAQSQGLASFTWTFDHLQELTGRLADKVVEHHMAAAG
ncbi:elongation factor G [Thalassobaculum litoreum]|uniref:Elongation factor G n=1 Tax=Thalassobaculum litoreum DSM 18839 TaxID=1123362 RepID=A0A8G2EXN8_9PROT|nr:elongation factor G [Thalassobaculum litoreum]SDF27649.1 translation elongation factor 2 (EF-2/EF-G) [Thalassobaculum litoreum DSM 18839]